MNKNFLISLLIFIVILLTYFSSGNIGSGDSKWVLYTAMSIIREGNTSLNEYADIISKNYDYAVEILDGHVYNIFPVGVPVISVPFLYAIDLFGLKLFQFFHDLKDDPVDSFELNNAMKEAFPKRIELFIASLITALTAVFLYKILLLQNIRFSLISIFIYAFCTSTWSTASRALWQHGPSMLLLTLSLYLILIADKKGWIIQFAAIPLFFSYIVRPTNSISIIILSLFVFFHYRRYFIYFIFWALSIALPFIIYNKSVYGSLFSTYYNPGRILSFSSFPEALMGNLISPSRGLFIFSPVLLFAIAGILIKYKQQNFKKLDLSLLLIILLHWIVISGYPQWWGGYSFGPRFFSDMIPFFIYFLSPVPGELIKQKGFRRSGLIVIGFGLLAFSFFVHFRGANCRDTALWNAYPAGIDSRPQRVWDLNDIQFLRGIIKNNIDKIEFHLSLEPQKPYYTGKDKPKLLVDIKSPNIWMRCKICILLVKEDRLNTFILYERSDDYKMAVKEVKIPPKMDYEGSPLFEINIPMVEIPENIIGKYYILIAAYNSKTNNLVSNVDIIGFEIK